VAVEFFGVRSLGLVLAVFWCFQGAICLAPWHADARQAGAAHDHQHASAQGDAGNDSAPQPPARDAGCEDHCVSLSQAISASPSAVPAPALLLIALFAADLPVPGFLARTVPGRREPPHPPPDLVIRHAALLI